MSDDTISGIDLMMDLRIPMRDGIHLGGTVLKPKGAAPVPCILTMTPYTTDRYHERAYYFSRHGYAFALVDCRGRGDSEGEFVPDLVDPEDGYDAVEWLARQPWCDGQVAMWGGSYAGENQWLTLKEFPAHLRTIVPAASGNASSNFRVPRPFHITYQMAWYTMEGGATTKWNLAGEERLWIEKYLELYLHHLPFSQLDRVFGNPSRHFQDWIAHPAGSPFWDKVTLVPDHYRRVDVPVLSITGHYDDDQRTALRHCLNHERYGTPEALARHYVVIGPWDHAGTRTPKQEFGGWRFDEAGLLDLNRLHKEWYDWTMKGGARPEFLKKRVAYYVTGAERWQYADSLESLADSRKRLYLSSTGGQANDVFYSGQLVEEPPARVEPDRFVYDPLDTRPAELEREPIGSYLTDQRYELNLFGNGLVYHTAPFEADTEVSGWVKLVAWLEIDVPDTDFQAILSEVLLDGSHLKLSEDLIRARNREGIQREKLVTPGEINRYEFGGFMFFARLVRRGSRLRLIVKCPNSIHLEKNYNGGGAVAEESGADARTAHVTLYHDPEHPSYLELPIVTR